MTALGGTANNAAEFWAPGFAGTMSPVAPAPRWLVENVREGCDVGLNLGGGGAWSYAISRIDIVESGMRVVVQERFTGTIDEYVDLDGRRFGITAFPERASLPEELWRFGVEYADGVRLTTADHLWFRRNGFHAHPHAVVAELGGGGHISDVARDVWFSPAPPIGVLTVAVEWPVAGVPFRSATIDLGELRRQPRTPVVWHRGAASLHLQRVPPPRGAG